MSGVSPKGQHLKDSEKSSSSKTQRKAAFWDTGKNKIPIGSLSEGAVSGAD
jgi:hypothetical protein